MNMRYLFLIIALVTYGMCNTIEVKKMFHHKAGIGEQKGKSIELGSIVLYLDQYPKVTHSLSKKGDITQQTFFLPAVTTISKEAQEVVNGINQAKDLPYSATISLKSNPNPGMEILLSYNDTNVGVCEPRTFDAISLHKALSIDLYDKKLIKRIGQESKPIIQMAHNTIRPHVIIDCGHGGHDIGAIGCNQVREKDVTLSIGLHVADLLRAHNITVALTRDSDRFVKLDERTTSANKQMADLFISIHANASVNKDTLGVETYCVASNLFKKESLFMSDNDGNFFSQSLSAKYNQSDKLAQVVHTSLIRSLAGKYFVQDRNVRHSVAQVLLGTTMPSILVEVGYLSHEKEAALLAQQSYQVAIAQGIVKGLQLFIETNAFA